MISTVEHKMPDPGTPGRSGNVPVAFDGGFTQLEHGAVSLPEQQRRHLEAVTRWAERIRETLGPVLEAHGDRVHFRPGKNGVTMIGLLADRPQRGSDPLRDLGRIARNFEALFEKHCQDIGQGRPTDEKALQSYLISEAHRSGRAMVSLNNASKSTSESVELVFITDEIPVPIESGKIVCDVLALRRDGGRSTPVLIELKNSRKYKCLVKQVESYSRLIDEHAESFAALFGAVLGQAIQFDGPVEKWIVWPASGRAKDPKEEKWLDRGVRYVAYQETGNGYGFAVGPSPRPPCPSCKSKVNAVPIVFGMPEEELEEQARRGEVVLGGCCVSDDDSRWFCKSCKREFR